MLLLNPLFFRPLIVLCHQSKLIVRVYIGVHISDRYLAWSLEEFLGVCIDRPLQTPEFELRSHSLVMRIVLVGKVRQQHRQPSLGRTTTLSMFAESASSGDTGAHSTSEQLLTLPVSAASSFADVEDDIEHCLVRRG